MNPSARPSWLALTLNLAGVVVVTVSLVRADTGVRTPWVLVTALVAGAAWAARGFFARLGASTADLVCCVIAVVAGAAVAAPTNGITVVPAAIGVLAAVSDTRRSPTAGIILALLGVLLIPLGAVPFTTSVAAVVAMMAGLVLSFFAGLSRRQFRRSEEQQAQLRERELQMREEASRMALARDLHDVLAHSLGGLVVQLDAADALLEAGETAAARTRVVDARGLAVAGLTEARRAVAALREPTAADSASLEDGAALLDALEDLLAAHRSLGGSAELVSTGQPRLVTAAQSSALRRALQEALSNARKHAPGAPVTVRLTWETDRVRLTVENPVDGSLVPGPLTRTGGGYGLEGLRERFAALPAGGRAAAGREDGRFVVTAEAMLA
ncbi:sensor histidine kinase [Leifsonia sp. AG29]|uniref:sensor histidine kinase n=1 Tax=Leifsonia sp. AG29 TaxID=2598860 RepID=UPI00131B6D83|nr:histidine kinase [Leifsonia sp. AG29]